MTCDDEDEQSEFVIGKILEHREQGIPLKQQAVLFRASHHAIALELDLAGHNIPFRKFGGLKFVETAHVKDLVSILRLAENPRDVVAAVRVLSLLPGIGPKRARALFDVSGRGEWRFSGVAELQAAGGRRMFLAEADPAYARTGRPLARRRADADSRCPHFL